MSGVDSLTAESPTMVILRWQSLQGAISQTAVSCAMESRNGWSKSISGGIDYCCCPIIAFDQEW